MSDSYLTSEELGILDEEHAALIGVIPILEKSGRPFSRPRHCYAAPSEPEAPGIAFSMTAAAATPTRAFRWARPRACGTVACIGGHISLIMQGVDLSDPGSALPTEYQLTRAMAYVRSSDYRVSTLRPLFYPPHRDIRSERWDKITGLSAAHAVRNFLRYKDPRWSQAFIAGGQGHISE